MYSECVKCQKLGISCDGPNFAAMQGNEFISWCKARKAHLGYSNGYIAEQAQMPKGTVDGFFAGAHADFRFETVRPIVRVLVGGEYKGNPCPAASGEERAAMESRIRDLENHNAHLLEKVADLTQTNAAMQTLITNTNKRNSESQAFLRDQIRGRNMVAAILGVLLGLCVFCILAALIVDSTNPDLGYIWMDGGLGYNALWLFFGVVTIACAAIGAIVFFGKRKKTNEGPR